MTSIDPASLNIPDDAWTVVEVTEDFIRYEAPLERFADGHVMYVQRTVPRALDALLEANRRALDESEGKRFGDGRIVASIPLNVLFDPKNQLAEKIREGDSEHLRWWLDREDGKPWRSFRGRLT